MYLMIADEADQDGSKQFLVFAGVFYKADTLLSLHKEVSQLREKYGFSAQDTLKSNPNTKPDSIDNASHAAIKNDILSLAAKYDAKICCYVVPHAIAKGQKHSDRMKFGTNTLLIKFDQFLRENGGVGGMAFFDQTSDFKQLPYLKEVFQIGMPYKGGRKRLENVVSIDNTGTNHSHLSSITDIVVGSFRFVANEPDKDKVGAILIGLLEQLMWGVKGGNGDLNVDERGICIRPINIHHPGHKADIAAFRDRLTSLSNQSE